MRKMGTQLLQQIDFMQVKHMMTLIKSLINYTKLTEQFRVDQQKLLEQIGNWISFSKCHLTKFVPKIYSISIIPY